MGTYNTGGCGYRLLDGGCVLIKKEAYRTPWLELGHYSGMYHILDNLCQYICADALSKRWHIPKKAECIQLVCRPTETKESCVFYIKELIYINTTLSGVTFCREDGTTLGHYIEIMNFLKEMLGFCSKRTMYAELWYK